MNACTFDTWVANAGAERVRHFPAVRAAWLAGYDAGSWQYWPVVDGRKVIPSDQAVSLTGGGVGYAHRR